MLLYGIQLDSNGILAHLLSRHDEGSAHIPVLYQTFAERNARTLRVAGCMRRSRIGDGRDDIGIDGRLKMKRVSDTPSHVVDELTVNNRVRTCKIDILKDTVTVTRSLGDLNRLHSRFGYRDQLSRVDVADELPVERIDCHGLGADDVSLRSLSETQRADSERIAESIEFVVDHDNDRIRPFELLHARQYRIRHRM